MNAYRYERHAPVPEPSPRDTWHKRGNCHGEDTEIFYPDPSQYLLQSKVILTYCHTCPVKAECLADDLAVDGPRWGIRGGMTATQRAKLVTRTAKGRPAVTECKQGHQYTDENTGRDHRGGRYCLTCKSERDYQKRQRSKRKQVA